MADLHHSPTPQDASDAHLSPQPDPPPDNTADEEARVIETLRQQLRRIEDRLDYLVGQVPGNFGNSNRH